MTWNFKYNLEVLINNLGKLLLHALQTLWEKKCISIRGDNQRLNGHVFKYVPTTTTTLKHKLHITKIKTR